MSVIDASSLRLEAPKTTADLLYQAGGVHIQKTQAGGEVLLFEVLKLIEFCLLLMELE